MGYVCSYVMWIVFVVLFVTSIVAEPPKPRPVVIWHGLGDDISTNSVGRLKEVIEDVVPGVFVLSIMIGDNIKEDEENSWHMKPTRQVDYVCKLISNHEKLKDGYNGVAMSQASQMFRAVAQKCPNPRIYNLITLAGQHQGFYGISDSFWFMKFLRPLLINLKAPSWKIVRYRYVPMNYWHDPTSHEDRKYREQNNFIAKINNEKYINKDYKKNLLMLENLVLVKFSRDSVVLPVETQWFEFYKPGQAKEIQPLEESRLWIEDRIGLRTLAETGRLHFIEHEEGDHLEFSNSWFEINIVSKYLV